MIESPSTIQYNDISNIEGVSIFTPLPKESEPMLEKSTLANEKKKKRKKDAQIKGYMKKIHTNKKEESTSFIDQSKKKKILVTSSKVHNQRERQPYIDEIQSNEDQKHF